jgi:hypothetical protein
VALASNSAINVSGVIAHPFVPMARLKV